MAFPVNTRAAKPPLGKWHYLRSFTVILLIIFFVELLIMEALPHLTGTMNTFSLSALDALLLTLLSAPFIWMLIAKPLEKAARSEMEWSESLLNLMNDGIVIVNKSDEVITLNPAAEAIFDCATGDVSGQSFRRLVSFPDSSPGAVTGQTRTSTPFTEATGWRRDGRTFPVELSVSNLHRHNHTLIIVILRDITLRKQAEQILREKNAELEGFLYTVSHDLKTPLVTISLFLDMIQDYLEKGDVEQALADMHHLHKAANKMLELMGGVIELSRANRTVGEPTRVTFQELATGAVETLAESITNAKAKVTVAEKSLDLFAEDSRLQIIWHNLLDNAIKFLGSQADPRVEIGFDLKDAGPVFFVCDNGMGIDIRYQHKIFGLFEQLDPTSGGTGLGLALAKRIVELYDGNLWVESAGSGEGACFRFTLPKALQAG